MPTAAPRLPGIRFETVTPPAPPGLPRMDVAAFAGFAASGPVGIPVAVEDVVRFGEIFGGELPLAWDPARGETTRAHLAPAVREFFRNGGRRCWVLRLAERPRSARFLLPGILRGRGGEVDGAAWARAVSPGSWADTLSVNATTLRKSLPAGAVEKVPRGFRVLRPGTHDLLRVDFPASGTVAFFPPRPVPGDADRTRAEREAEALRPAAQAYWFRALLPGRFPASPPAALRFLGADESRVLAPTGWEIGVDEVRVSLSEADAAGIQPGCFLLADVPVTPIPFLRSVFLLVDEEERGDAARTFVVRRAWRMLEPAPAWGVVDGEGWVASLAAAELWARRTSESLLRAADVAMAPGHPRYFGLFPGDQLLYEPVAEVARDVAGPVLWGDVERGVAAPLWAELGRPRFPLAAPRRTAGDVFLPLGLLALPRDDVFQPAQLAPLTALERDGLAAFGPDLFLDPVLGLESAETLVDTAFHRQYQLRPGVRPTRMHALLPVEEASILALPDAVHTGWTWREGSEHAPPALPAAPAITSVAGPDAEGVLGVAWTAVDGAAGYLLEDSPDPRFRRDVRRTASATPAARLLRPAPCPAAVYLRVRAEAGSGRSAWSATWLQGVAADRFHACGRVPLPAPALAPPALEEQRLALTWSGPGDAFVLESSVEPSFGAPTPLYAGPARQYEVWAPDGAAYFRVAASRGGEESPWSATAAYEPPPAPRWESAPEADPALLPRLHEAMLRFCAARSDIFAVLSLPVRLREEEALAHAAALASALGAGAAEPGDQAARTLSFGALYHPWTVVRTSAAGQPTRAIPPDGAASGVIAARALGVGAWAAPANQPLAGVVALEPKLGDAARAAFLGRRVNALAPFTRGFMAWSEETLSDDPTLAGIGVRRLLIVLRRLALREGNLYVFQPNDAAFRRLVQRQFDALLADMFSRGAFAGAVAEQGYRVVTDDTVNPAGGVELGRFVVELRVAPSRPMAFLTVRLVQTGAGVTVQER
ncbi:MAG TPA: hypothetical protein VEX86_03465 [Longimicrobium sp.]|nr:hypothetical protein [Longimicrobium sp.]